MTFKKLTAVREAFYNNAQSLYQFKPDDPRRVSPLSLNFLKKQSKQLLKEILKSRKASYWGEIIKHHPHADSLNTENIKLSDIQWVIAKQSGFASWAKLKHHIEATNISTKAINSDTPSSLDSDKKTLHIRCGNDIMQPMAIAGFSGDFLTFADPYVMGAVPQTTTEDEFIHIRAEVISSSFEEQENAYVELSKDYENLYHAKEYERIMLWFEHDAYDVLTFLKLLHFFHDPENRPGQNPQADIQFICITSYPGVKQFNGIGQLPPEAMRALWERFKPVSEAQFEFGKKSWEAYTASDPVHFQKMVYSEGANFPALQPAMRRQLQDLPWLIDGLTLTERLTLSILKDHGKMKADELFFKWYVLHYEPLVFLGDSMYWIILDQLATAKHPAISSPRSNQKIIDWEISLTDFGEALLNQQAHWVKDNGINRWLGGTHNYCEAGEDNQKCWYFNDSKKTVEYS